MTEPLTSIHDFINSWADDTKGPVALHLKQRLLPVEGEGGVVFPPTYADIGYNIDTLSDGTKVAMIDSVGSQANRMEPIFKDKPYAELVPQIEIELHTKEDGGKEDGGKEDGGKEDGGKTYVEKLSLLDLGHRAADAVVRSSQTLCPDVTKAFSALKCRGDAGPLCRLAPTSLLFGVWDSRGESGIKCPRLVRSIIRAWDVQPLSAAAQFNSVWEALNTDQQGALKREAEAKSSKLSAWGLADAPAVFRKVRKGKVRQFLDDGSPNPAQRVLGGVVASGRIERTITINLIALRAIEGADGKEAKEIRRYLLALALIAATADMDMFLREGCHLRYAGDDVWEAVPRRGAPTAVDLASDTARNNILDYARKASSPFKAKWPDTLKHKFDLKEAKKLLAKKTNKEEGEA